jgi:hypothetical protein
MCWVAVHQTIIQKIYFILIMFGDHDVIGTSVFMKVQNKQCSIDVATLPNIYDKKYKSVAENTHVK